MESKANENQQCMGKWFEECLWPQMKECESKILKQCTQSLKINKRKNAPSKKRFHNSANKVKRKSTTCFQAELPNTKMNAHFSPIVNTRTDDIDAEFQKFKLENERHQLEIKKEREEQTVYILDTDSPVRMPKPTNIAPTQHPQNIKLAEMKAMYGYRFYSIQLLELKLQARFDTMNDTNHPPLWPFIPLKI
uniref:Gem-associated protein 8-like n=1 Tax=Phallusia mammillata TaxID=59560 RepID=A0A6F9DCZ4_9ASCI|nr:gem-associated protein 8-like [Phallusia mammillata]